jgi:uncharacterized FlaG/YvyC family protein
LQFYGLPQEKQLIFRKSLERFNHAVNFENDKKFQQLITHRRQYNGYIKMMAKARESQERAQREKIEKFEEKIQSKVKEFQVMKTSRLDTKESGCESNTNLMSFRKRR